MENLYSELDDGYFLKHLVAHLIDDGEEWELATELLTDFDFIQAECVGGMAFGLLRDCDRAIGLCDLPVVVQIRQALSLALPSLTARPEWTIQSIYNRLNWFEGLELELRNQLKITRSQLNQKPFWISAEAPLPESEANTPSSFPLTIRSNIQSVSRRNNAIAIGAISGEVEIYNIANGELLKDGERRLAPRTIAIALSDNDNSLAYIDVDGVIRSERVSATLPGRPKEKLLLNLSTHGIIAVRNDDALVSWQPDGSKSVALAEDLPAPLVVLRSTLDDQYILYVAGYKNQMIGVAVWMGNKWVMKSLPYIHPYVLDADLDPEDGVPASRLYRSLPSHCGLGYGRIGGSTLLREV